MELAGRAGRIQHDSVGVVGLAAGNKPQDIVKFTSKMTGALASRLVKMLDSLEQNGKLYELQSIIFSPDLGRFPVLCGALVESKEAVG